MVTVKWEVAFTIVSAIQKSSTTKAVINLLQALKWAPEKICRWDYKLQV